VKKTNISTNQDSTTKNPNPPIIKSQKGKRTKLSKDQLLTLLIGFLTLVAMLLIGFVNHQDELSDELSDFSISVDPMEGKVEQGGVVQTSITVESINGYDKSISLSSSQQPSGVVITFVRPIGGASPSYTSNLMINVDKSVLIGKHEIEIKGQGADGKMHSTYYNLLVVPHNNVEDNITNYAVKDDPAVSIVEITYPNDNTLVDYQETVRGTSKNIPEGSTIWVVVLSSNRYYPQPNSAAISSNNGEWYSPAYLGEPYSTNVKMDICAIIADSNTQQDFETYLAQPADKRKGLDRLPEGIVYDQITVERGS